MLSRIAPLALLLIATGATSVGCADPSASDAEQSEGAVVAGAAKDTILMTYVNDVEDGVGLAASGGDAFVANWDQGSVSRLAGDDTTPHRFAGADIRTGPIAITHDNGRVYWIDKKQEKIFGANADGSHISGLPSAFLASNPIIATDADSIYWTGQDYYLRVEHIQMVSKQGGESSTFAPNPNPKLTCAIVGLVADSDSLYTAQNCIDKGGVIATFSKASATWRSLAWDGKNGRPLGDIRGFHVDANALYYVVGADSHSRGEVVRLDRNGNAQTLVSGVDPQALGGDESSLYFADPKANTINAVPKAGGRTRAIATLASTLPGATIDVHTVVATADHIYYEASQVAGRSVHHNVVRFAKPTN